MDYSGHDFYCDVALKGSVSLKIEYESDLVLAYHHTQPSWPMHIVVVPKKHIASLAAIQSEDMPIFRELLDVAKVLALKVEKENGGARILTNLGKYQDSKHLHFHITSGEPL